MICGCGPVYRKAPRQPLPKESTKSKERTRKAVQVFVDHFEGEETKPELKELAKSLLIKIGSPARSIKNKAKHILDLADKLRQDTRDIRKKQDEWDREYDKDMTFIQSPKTIGEKVDSIIWRLIIGGFLIGLALLIFVPKTFAGIVAWVKMRFDQGVKVLREQLKQAEKSEEQTIEAIEVIKKEKNGTWEEIEPIFKEKHDLDVQDRIKQKIKKY